MKMEVEHEFFNENKYYSNYNNLKTTKNYQNINNKYNLHNNLNNNFYKNYYNNNDHYVLKNNNSKFDQSKKIFINKNFSKNDVKNIKRTNNLCY